MKQCLELLKGVVPVGGDLTKHTTLGLLTSATALIKALREAEQMQKNMKDQLVREQQYLRWQYEQLSNDSGQFHGVGGPYRGLAGQYRVRPSVSESSSASNESSSTTSSELDDVDVTGSGLSDVDERSSDTSTGYICTGFTAEGLTIDSL